MAVVSRDLSITYGSYSIVPGSNRFLNEFVRESTTPDETSIEFEWVVTADTDAALVSEVGTIRTQFRTHNQRLQVTQNAEPWLDLNPDDSVGTAQNTGFAHTAEIIKDGDEGDTGRSHTFRVKITVQLPADVQGNAGQRNYREQIVYDESRIRTVIFTGEWTALSTENSALAQYQASIDAYIATVKTALGISTWEQIGDEEIDLDEHDKTLNYRVIYREIIFNQASGVLDNAAIVNQKLTVDVASEWPGDSPSQSLTSIGGNSGRLLRIEIRYDASIDQTESTDLASLWENTIKPYVIAHALTVASASSGAAVRIIPTYNGPQNRISASGTMLAIGPETAGTVEYEYTEERDEETGAALDPVWDGHPLSAYVYQGPKIVLRNVTERARVLGSSVGGAGGGGGGVLQGGFRPGINFRGGLRNVGQGGFRGRAGINLIGPADAGGGAPPQAPGDPTYILLRQRNSDTPRRLGEPGNQIDVVDKFAFRSWRLVRPTQGVTFSP